MSASSFSSPSEPDIIEFIESPPPSPTSQPTVASIATENLPGHPSELKQVALGSSPLPAVRKDTELTSRNTFVSTLSAMSMNDVLSEPDKSLKSFKFFFPDGNVTFLVEDTVYRLHRYLFIRHSSKFASEFLQHDSDNNTPIKLDAIDKRGFEALLSILYPLDFTRHNIEGVNSWSSVLHIATEWGFKSIRELAIQTLAPIVSPVDQVAFGEKYGVEAWLFPGFQSLCSRPESLTLEEGRRLGLENVIVIDSARQEIRDNMSSRSTAAIATTECLACKTPMIYSLPLSKPEPPVVDSKLSKYDAPSPNPSSASLSPSVSSHPFTSSLPSKHPKRTSSWTQITAILSSPGQKQTHCRLCGVQRGKLSNAEISDQVEQFIPQFSIAREARLRAENSEAELKARAGAESVARAKAELEARAKVEWEARAKAGLEAKLKADWEAEAD